MLYKVRFDDKNLAINAKPAGKEALHRSRGYIQWTQKNRLDMIQCIYVYAWDRKEAMEHANKKAASFLGW